MLKILCRILLVFLAFVLLWGLGLVAYGVSSISMKAQDVDHVDGIIVLTGGPGRVEKGLELFSQKKAEYMLITGIHPKTTKADVLGKYAQSIPDCCLTYGYKATTTVENGIEAREWVQELGYLRSVILITSNYHMHRSYQEIAHALPGITIYRYPVHAGYPVFSKTVMRLLVLEYHKFLYRSFVIYTGMAR